MEQNLKPLNCSNRIVEDLILFINDVIIFDVYPRFSLQTIHVLRVYNVPSIHGWSDDNPAENDGAIFEQPLKSKFDNLKTVSHKFSINCSYE